MARYIVAVLDFRTELSMVNNNSIKSPTLMVLANHLELYMRREQCLNGQHASKFKGDSIEGCRQKPAGA
jgi:hypothetical protein